MTFLESDELILSLPQLFEDEEPTETSNVRNPEPNVRHDFISSQIQSDKQSVPALASCSALINHDHVSYRRQTSPCKLIKGMFCKSQMYEKILPLQ